MEVSGQLLASATLTQDKSFRYPFDKRPSGPGHSGGEEKNPVVALPEIEPRSSSP